MTIAKRKSRRSGKAETWGLFGVGALAVIAGLILTLQFVKPAPPHSIRIAAGSSSGAYYHYAERYREILARAGIELEILETAGSVENIALLQDGDARVDLGLIQGGIPIPTSAIRLESLGSLFYEPVWILSREDKQGNRLNTLTNKRIAVGPEGSGTRFIALSMLEASGIDQANTEIISEDLKLSAERLIDGDIDLIFMVGAADSPLLRRLVHTPGIHIHDLPRADAYARTHSALIALKLPEGTLDLRRDVPGTDVRLVASTASLVARSDFHPALVDLLIEAAGEVHGAGDLFASPGAFPSPIHPDLPLNSEAQRHYENGPPFLQRYLPFWAATLVDRLKVMLLPMIGLLFPLFKVMPPLYRWRIRSRIYRWYARLKEIDNAATAEGIEAAELERLHTELARIESEAEQVEVPLSYTDQLYNLRLHIKLIRDKLDQSRA